MTVSRIENANTSSKVSENSSFDIPHRRVLSSLGKEVAHYADATWSGIKPSLVNAGIIHDFFQILKFERGNAAASGSHRLLKYLLSQQVNNLSRAYNGQYQGFHRRTCRSQRKFVVADHELHRSVGTGAVDL